MKNYITKIYYFLFFFSFLGTTNAQNQKLSEIINNKETLIIDVRPTELAQKEKIENAINIPLKDLENNLYKLDKDKDIVLFCRSGNTATKAEELLKKKGFKKIHNAKTAQNMTLLKKSNLYQSQYFSSQKPHFNVLKENTQFKQMAVSLGKNIMIEKHKSPTPIAIIVLKGKIKFIINEQEILLNPHDYYELPAEMLHEVIGIENENLFIITKQK